MMLSLAKLNKRMMEDAEYTEVFENEDIETLAKGLNRMGLTILELFKTRNKRNV